MNGPTVGIAATALLLIVAAARADTGEPSAPPTLVIRIYRHADVSLKDVTDALDYAEGPFRNAGVALTWIDCGRTGGGLRDASVTCGRPLTPNEVILRIRPAGPADAAPFTAMGVSLVSAQAVGTPLFSTVFIDRVVSVSRAAGVDARRVLGCAIAHEIGHLLLNSFRHSEVGLMRAVWSGVELRRATPADWTFEPAQALIVYAAAEARWLATPERRAETSSTGGPLHGS